MQGHDERLSKLLRERQDVLPVLAPEDPVFVLQEHDVDIDATDRSRRAEIVATDLLVHDREHAETLRSRRFVENRDDVRARDAVGAGERSTEVGRKGADATRARRIRGDDRGAHSTSRPTVSYERYGSLLKLRKAANGGLVRSWGTGRSRHRSTAQDPFIRG